VALAVWQPWRKGEKSSSATAPSSQPAPSPSTGLSEARQLVAKARPLFEALDSNRDDFKLAGEMLAQAKAKDSADAEVWAAEAQLDERYMIRGWDGSDERREAARAATQRALRLDPQSFEVRFAQAQLLAYTGREGTERERLLRELYREQPTDHRVLRELGSTIERQGRTDEGIVFMDEAAALPGGDPLALYNKSLALWFIGRTAEAETTLRAAIAQKPFAGALLMSVWYAMVLHGDLAGARATLDRMDTAELLEDRGCFFAYFLHSLAREPDASLACLAAMPRDWLNDNWYRGPKGRLIGDALQLAGRPEAAAAEWRAALKLVEARLATNPTNSMLLYNRVLLLGKLGEREEAARQFAVLLQMSGFDLTHDTDLPPWVADTCVLLGRKDDAIRLIAHSLEQKRHAVDYTAAVLRLDPVLDPLRGEPEFQKLITEADAIEKTAAQAAVPGGKP
jgi:tetratricopeptide (TPR) repeat protein